MSPVRAPEIPAPGLGTVRPVGMTGASVGGCGAGHIVAINANCLIPDKANASLEVCGFLTICGSLRPENVKSLVEKTDKNAKTSLRDGGFSVWHGVC